MSLISFLQEKNRLDDNQLAVVANAIAEKNLSEEKALLEHGFTQDDIRTLAGDYYGVPAFTFNPEVGVPQDVLKYIPEESAFHYKITPLSVEDGVLLVGVNNPDDIQIREVLNFISTKFNIPYKIVFLIQSDLEAAQKFYENLRGDVTDALVSLEATDKDMFAEAEKIKNDDESLEHIKEDAPVTKIVATILRYAIDGAASDIHVEPTETKVVVRFRVDGILQTSLELPKNTERAVAARIKILASLRLDEKRKPQDGRFSATFDGRKVDFRVSVLPTSHGEKVVMRILDNEKGVRTLEDVGITGHSLSVIRRLLHEPYGIILISGPTGSGKSTTLYSMLSEVDRAGKNVLSLEDPVEYNIEGISQSQIRPEIGYTFAHGLRAALRQDPDIIMVGEIRDKETAQLAIQAALTGHLVLSTIHTNNSIGVIPRLIDMGIDPYLIAPTLKLAIAQRLARRLKPGTGREEPVTGATKIMIDEAFRTLPEKYHDRIPKQVSIMHPEPSPGCATGMKGRVAIMETLEINEEIQSLILKNASEEEIYHSARSHGFVSMKEDAIIKALDHIIPYEEMSAFGTRVGVEEVTEGSAAPVDNFSITEEEGV
jgi:type IV pilus assembly protein PilB